MDRKYNNSDIILCCAVNIQDAINYDLSFPLSEEGEPPGVNVKNHSLHTTKYTYTIRDNQTLIESEVKTGVTYRARLKGIIEKYQYDPVTDKRYLSKELISLKRKAKEWLIEINRDLWSIFVCKIYNVDIYNRILVDLINPLSGEMISEQLIKLFPELYSIF